MFAAPDVGQIVPIGGTAALFVFMLRTVWTARSDWVTEKASMRKEWAATKAELIAENDKALERMQNNCATTTDTLRRLHVDELGTLNRRIDNLEAEIARGKT